jgi:sec-independent protein translocase protein TatC
VSFPIIAHQLWRFVAPGLYASEKGAILPFLFASPMLFFMGASFAHYVVTPLAMNFFIGFADAIPILTSLHPGAEPPAVSEYDSCDGVPRLDPGIDSTWR